MAAMTRFDKIVLGLTAAFLVVTGGYFVSGQLGEAEYQVTVSKQAPAVSASLPEVEDGYPDSLLEGEVIDLNTASVADLTRRPGSGEKRAQAIVDYRESSGPFQSVEELTEVKGIGEGILAQVYDYVTVGGPDSPAE